MKNIAPEVQRLRLIFEGIYNDKSVVSIDHAKQFLSELSSVLGMTIVHGPDVNNYAHKFNPEKYGALEGWVIWVESGAQLYMWENPQLVTLDLFTCKTFDKEKAIKFIAKWFKCEKFETISLPNEQN